MINLYSSFINKLFNLLMITACVSCCISCQPKTNINNTSELLQAMKAKNDSNWFQHYIFKQRTITYDEFGAKTDSSTWYEAVSYPYNFRIDWDIDKGVYGIFRNDSTYYFRQDSLINALDDPSKHLMYKGGLYFVSLNEALNKLEKYGYDIKIFKKVIHNNKPTYIIGADDEQFWMDAEHFYTVRRIYTTSNGKIMDIHYENHKPLKNGWVEQKVTFYRDGKKMLEEFYYDVKVLDSINDKIFDIKSNYKWYLNY